MVFGLPVVLIDVLVHDGWSQISMSVPAVADQDGDMLDPGEHHEAPALVRPDGRPRSYVEGCIITEQWGPIQTEQAGPGAAVSRAGC